MKIEKYILLHFDNLRKPQDKYQIVVPIGSKFLGLGILHDGIYCWYAIREILVERSQVEEFAIVTPNKSIPDNTKFIALLDTMMQVSKTEQGQMVFPVFKFISQQDLLENLENL